MREFLEAGGRAMSFDERKLALISIVPAQIRADIMIRLHMFPEPPPGSSQQVQDESFTQLRTTLSKQLELTIQLQAMGSMRGGGPVNNMSDEPVEQKEEEQGDEGWGD